MRVMTTSALEFYSDSSSPQSLSCVWTQQDSPVTVLCLDAAGLLTPSTGPAEDAPPAPHICPPQDKSHTCPCSTQLKATLEVQKKQIQNSDLSVQQIQAFLEPQEDVHEPQHLLPPKTLLRYAQLLDIVRPSCRRSVCFTKGAPRWWTTGGHHSGGPQWWTTAVDHSRAPQQGTTVVDRSGGPQWWTTVVDHSGGPQWWTTVVDHSGGPQRWTAMVDRSRAPQWWTTVVDHSRAPQWWTTAGYHSGGPQQGTTAGDHSRVPQRWTTAVNHSGGPQQGTTAVDHSRAPQRWTTAGYHSGGPQQGTTAVDHSGEPQRWTTAGYHSGGPQQGTTAVDHSGEPQRYRKYVEGTGSVLQCCLDTSVEDVFPSLDQCSEEEKVQRLLDLKLRYFTPREVANLMGFPQSFTFPESVSTKQQYRLLGNSLNVVVVAKLLQLLVTPEQQHKDGGPH
ncbi:tRNA (cytosine(38)-C(5))-methyltransferase [Takifugu flavidus]|uniref:tRNA (cytosine(38)-C(5))-methyltransferase n=1 Tax=Takifugu flavidus TaxID=433684 RepID=A0A5C6NXE2_9TELE|nr:tRNA (cytosine(38)-C(5))-methyltransferase [Takifugu flavidus]